MQTISIAARAERGEFKFNDLSGAAQVVLRLFAAHTRTEKGQLISRAETKGIGSNSAQRAADFLVDNGLVLKSSSEHYRYQISPAGATLMRTAPPVPAPARHPRRTGPMQSPQYLAPELRRTCNRVGAYAAFALPSLSRVSA